MTFPDVITCGNKYGPAMEITDQAEADTYFEQCVVHQIGCSSKSRAEAEVIEHSNLGYYAGYYDAETRVRVERLFRCKHPVLGAIVEKGPPSPAEAFALGQQLAANTNQNGGPHGHQRPE